MHRHRNEELIRTPGRNLGGLAVSGKKHTLLLANLMHEYDSHSLGMIIRASEKERRIITVAAHPFYPRLLNIDSKQYGQYEQDIVGVLSAARNAFIVLLPFESEVETAKTAFSRHGAEFAFPPDRIIYSSRGDILSQAQPTEINSMLFPIARNLFGGNGRAIADLRAALAEREVEGVFVCGIGPEGGPVSMVGQAIRKMREETMVKAGFDDKGGPVFSEYSENAFVAVNPLVAKNMAEF